MSTTTDTALLPAADQLAEIMALAQEIIENEGLSVADALETARDLIIWSSGTLAVVAEEWDALAEVQKIEQVIYGAGAGQAWRDFWALFNRSFYDGIPWFPQRLLSLYGFEQPAR